MNATSSRLDIEGRMLDPRPLAPEEAEALLNLDRYALPRAAADRLSDEGWMEG